METILNLIKDYYLIFVIIAGILFFALIGVIADKNIGKDISIKRKKNVANMDTKETSDNIETL